MLDNVIYRKVKSMKVSDYFEYKKCEYAYLQLIVTKSNRNTNTEQIASLVNKMFKKTNKYICQASKRLIIEERPKASFYIHITKDKVQFYFIIPKIFQNQFKTKFKEIWKNIEIKEVDNIPIDFNQCTKFDLHYKYDDSLSLAVDKRNNDLLNANMSIVDMLEQNESVGIFYNFIPTSDKESNYFKSKTYKNAIARFKNGENLKKSKNYKDYSIIIIKNLIDFINDLLNSFFNTNHNNQLVLNPLKIETSYSTKRKGEKAICKNQTIILAKSTKKEREIELSNTLANTFKSISDNNELVVTEITKNIDIKRTIINHTTVNKTTIEEDSNFINMPSTEVIKQFDMIEHNKVLELKAPVCLEKGEVRIGTLKDKGNSKEIYYSTDEQFKRLSRVLLGSMGAGKDYYMVNLAKDIIAANRGLFAIDYIDDCPLANKIKAITPKEKLVEINCDNVDQLQAFLYNEVTYSKYDDMATRIEVS
ncbi:MAG TPA: hypothetical protein DDY58_01235, partial [Terrisporobacter glycolicus]|uniref:hypothetical protein n=1 Tax=Terrisporobacter hibernicus TaxID=2813371 RepID=UPI000E909B98